MLPIRVSHSKYPSIRGLSRKKNKELHITKKKRNLEKFNSYTLSFEAFLSLSETIGKFRKGKRESFLLQIRNNSVAQYPTEELKAKK